MKYKVYEVEDKMTNTGKALKKLTLQGDGKQYPDKNVTMWADHPLFEDIAAGQTVDIELDVQDGASNPKGGVYKNKTVKKEVDAPKSDRGPATKDAGSAEIKNILQLKIIPMLESIQKELVVMNERAGFEDKGYGGESPF